MVTEYNVMEVAFFRSFLRWMSQPCPSMTWRRLEVELELELELELRFELGALSRGALSRGALSRGAWAWGALGLGCLGLRGPLLWLEP